MAEPVKDTTPTPAQVVQSNPADAPAVRTEDVDVHAPRPARPNRGPHKSLTQLAAEVHAGWWGSSEKQAERLQAAGFDADRVAELVAKGVGKTAAERLGARPADFNETSTGNGR